MSKLEVHIPKEKTAADPTPYEQLAEALDRDEEMLVRGEQPANELELVRSGLVRQGLHPLAARDLIGEARRARYFRTVVAGEHQSIPEGEDA